jgi:hypothetical protein
MLYLHSATVKKITTLSDKTIKIELFMREMPHDEMALLFESYMVGTEGVAIKEIETDGLKTPSARLRNCIYVLWEKSSQEKTFEVFYLDCMEKIIDKIKDKLN